MIFTIYVLYIVIGITFNVTVGVKLLQMSLGMPTEYRGHTIGLLGNFNQNKTDDFRARGSTESLASNITEKEIFKQFGQTCKYTCQMYICIYVIEIL